MNFVNNYRSTSNHHLSLTFIKLRLSLQKKINKIKKKQTDNTVNTVFLTVKLHSFTDSSCVSV